MFVVIEIIGPGIVGYIEIRPAIIVIVRPDSLHSEIMIRIVDAGLLGYIFEGSISAVAEKKIGFSRQSPRTALYRNAAEPAGFFVAPKLWKFVGVNIHVARDE